MIPTLSEVALITIIAISVMAGFIIGFVACAILVGGSNGEQERS